LRGFMLETVQGSSDLICFHDVIMLVENYLGYNREQFVSAFEDFIHAEYGPNNNLSQEDMVVDILLNYREEDRKDDYMRFRDVYRLVSALGETLQSFTGQENDDGKEAELTKFAGETFGSYRITRELGRGKHTDSVVYKCAHINFPKTHAALKWPVAKAEVDLMEDLHLRAKDKPGLPGVLETGEHDGQPYFVMPLLGTTLSIIFGRLEGHPLRDRWAAIRIIGRMLLRRCEVLHRLGYVHCDVAPYNVLLGPRKRRGGRTDVEGDGVNSDDVSLYLIDFGTARKYPGGGDVEGDVGSMEFSSIRSALGGERKPEDDLEALGWVLLTGLFGDLPWFEWLEDHYKLKSPP